jgi:anthranilate phosphoribosyltransferase
MWNKMIQEAIYQLLNKEDLSLEQTKSVMDEIMSGNATNAQIASFVTAIRMKGETIDEITACAMIMRKHGVKLKHEGDVLDIVGTGGDEAYTFNISTVSSFIIAAAGIPVQSTVTAVSPVNAAVRMCWKLWELRLIFRLKKVNKF